MFTKLFVGLLVFLGVFAAVVATRPDDFRVTRSLLISAPADRVFQQVNDLHKWEAWSPWAKLDPNGKTSYAGPASGAGAAFSWDGNSQVGEGTMTITESRPTQFLQFRLDFRRPMTATNTAEFVFAPQGDQTKVTWTMYGRNNFLGKAVSLVMNCDKMIGGQFETGLAQLKAVAEAEPKPAT